MDEYEKIEIENKLYAKRVMDLYCDAKKWKMLAEHTTDDSRRHKYMEIANNLYDLFEEEIEKMK